MGGYIPITEEQKQQMLDAIGLKEMDDLFSDIPNELRCKELAMLSGKSELEVRRIIEGYAAENVVFNSVFRGAGAYRHYIPSIVKQVASKETFVTAYTPYQAEMSQGVLQAIFEYQTEICMLTGMDVSNASVYDGASAAAEAPVMCRERKRQRVLVAQSAHPDTIATIQTYCNSANAPMQTLATSGGRLDLDALAVAVQEDVACLYIQSPNYFGLIEEVEQAAEICHAAGVKLIMGSNPMALALFKTPAECGADIAVGEGQPLGLPMAFGGPWLGFMACKKDMMRRLPGRIVGQTQDGDGQRCFVLTLQAREQHIRREKALSSICSNQALCALTATVYLAAMGPKGFAKVAQQCYSNAHYLAQQLQAVGYELRYEGEFFHEFVTSCSANAQNLQEKLQAKGILGGLPLGDDILWCCTEMNTKQEMDELVAIAKEVAGS